VKAVIAIAPYARKPLAIEKLDLAGKKQDLKDCGVPYARMLSRLAYSQVLSTTQARAFDAGLPVYEVNPACMVVLGKGSA
jgi:hypothetical protein